MQPTHSDVERWEKEIEDHIQNGRTAEAQNLQWMVDRARHALRGGNAPTRGNNPLLHSSSSISSSSATPPSSPSLSPAAAPRAVPTKAEIGAATRVQRAFRRHLTRNIPPKTVKHVHWGDTGENPYTKQKQWDTGGLHNMESLRIRAQKEGIDLQRTEADPATGVIQAQVKKPNTIQQKKVKGGGEKTVEHQGGRKGHNPKEPYTLYPEDLSASEMDIAAGIAFRKAKRRAEGTQYIEPNAQQPLGRFEANVMVGRPPRPIRIQGHFTNDGKIASHYPILPPEQPGKGNHNNNNNNNSNN